MALLEIIRISVAGCCFFICFILLGLLALPPLQAEPMEGRSLAREEVSNYKLGMGDHIRIQVFNEEDLTVEAKLTDAGTITYPFLGEIKVAGMTIGQLADYITQRLKGPYLVNPKVGVSVIEYREFFIYGEVGKPGNYPYQPGLTIQRAVAIAGGFTERASRRSITVEKEDDPTHTPKYVDLTDPVQPGDIVTVEESFF